MAYVLGYFAADGSMLTNRRGGRFIEFTSTDRILIHHVQKATGSSHTVTARIRGGNTKTSYRLQIGNNIWFSDLARLGFSQAKSNILKFPAVPEEFIGDFVRGYFDGDGCVYFKSHFAKDRNRERWVFQTQFISGSKEFLKTLWIKLKAKGVVGGHIYERVSGASNLVFSWKDSVALHRLMYHTAPSSPLYLPRKREKLERAIQTLGLGN